jgi:phosphoglycolate phosphatase-like HAD superfamily hydrolase
MHYLIFDFDGVLGDTLHDTKMVKTKIENISYEQASDDILAHFSKPSHSKSDDPTAEKLVEVLKWSHNFGYLLSKTDFPIFTGFIDEIKKIKDFKSAIVSSGSKVYIDRVKNLGVDFTHILDVFDHHSKEEKIKTICADWSADINDVYYFTDTQSDVIELRNVMNPTKIIGCSWGFQGYDKLLEVLPKEQILNEFKDIHKIIY